MNQETLDTIMAVTVAEDTLPGRWPPMTLWSRMRAATACARPG
jgi:hypothetical protein